MNLLFAYLGPETIMPLTSVLAAVVGVFLMFGRFVIGTITWPFRKLFGRKSTTEDTDDNQMNESVSPSSIPSAADN